MRIGFFDSGLGGLVILRAAREALPQHDFVYLGDTLHLPYGGRSNEAIYAHTKSAIDYLFRVQDCALIVIACNTASAAALRRLQQEYLVESFPDRRVLGVVIPTLEVTHEKHYKRIGLLATQNLVQSRIYEEELQKLDADIQIFSEPAPLLVPLIEHNGHAWIDDILQHYLTPLLAADIQALILGCTHYPFLRPRLKKILPETVDILSQDDIIPYKLADYLKRHPEIEEKLDKTGQTVFCVTDMTQNYLKTAAEIYGSAPALEKVVL